MPLTRLFRFIGALLTLATLALVWRLGAVEWRSLSQAERCLQNVAQLRLALSAAEMLSRERGPTNGLLGEAVPLLPARVQALAEARQRSDQALQALLDAVPATGDERHHQMAEHLLALRDALAAARSTVDRTAALPLAQRGAEPLREAVRGMVALIPRLAPTISLLASDAQQAVPSVAESVHGARLAAELREYAGLLGSLFTPALTRQQPFGLEERAAIERVRGRIEELRFLLELQAQLAAPGSEVPRAHAQMQEHYFGGAAQLLTEVLAAGQRDGHFGMDPATFAARYVPDMNVIFSVRDAMLTEAHARAAAVQGAARRSLWLVAGGASLLLAVVLGMLHLVHRRIIQPLAQTTEVLRAMAHGELTRPVPRAQADDEIAAVIGAIAALQRHASERAALEHERNELIDRLRDQSNTDFLTGLPNRRAFFQAAERELAQAQRHGHGVVLVLLDIDHFKQVNDSLGHAAGDESLVAVATALRRALRLGDLAARLGGEEFVVLLSHCDPEQGLRFAERLRETIAGLPIRAGEHGTPVRITASLGLADGGSPGMGLDKLLSRADEAMYAAKQAGRNRCMAAPRQGDHPLQTSAAR